MSDLKQRLAMERRLARRERRRAEYHRGLRPFAIAAWNTTKEHNVGSLVRTAHATAASELLFVGDREWNVEAARTAELYTTVTHLADAGALLAHILERGMKLVAIELDTRSVGLFEAEYPENPCFLLGAEIGGVPSELLGAAELVVQIPQWGLVPSLNLAVAGSVVVYDYLSKLNRDGNLRRPQGGLLEVDPSSGDDGDHTLS